MRCYNCGSEIPQGAKYCLSCGRKIGDKGQFSEGEIQGKKEKNGENHRPILKRLQIPAIVRFMIGVIIITAIVVLFKCFL